MLLTATSISTGRVNLAEEREVPSQHSNNWAVLVCTSRYWFNYRHLSNILSMYYIIRKMGIPDNQIILMNAMDSLCDSRNPFPGEIYSTTRKDVLLNSLRQQGYNNSTNGYDGVEVDYRGDEVNVDSFLRLLTGRHHLGTPASKVLKTDNESNILIFLTGHGGDEFLKFRDVEEISSQDLGFAFREMEFKGRYKEILLIVDTCQASTLANAIRSPRIITIGSSGKGENSYAHDSDEDLGVAVIDRFSYSVSEFFQNRAGILAGNSKNEIPQVISNFELKSRRKILSLLTLQDLFNSMNYQFLRSTVILLQTNGSRNPAEIPLTDFFSQIEIDVKITNFTILNNNRKNDAVSTENIWKADHLLQNSNSDLFYLPSN
jgi:phosphatidylinositol glycan class K